jgi:uncharacterized membrane protein
MLGERLLILEKLRAEKPTEQKIPWKASNIGERCSDSVAAIVGSWSFIIIQALIFAIWILLNIFAWINAWDPYPFILLNLVLAFQASFTAPIIMMSQNRQSEIDRKRAENDYNINIKAELEIELLHKKIDELKEQEIKKLIEIISDLERKLPKSDDKSKD